MRKDEAMLKELASVVQKSVPNLLRESFGGVFGQAFPRCTANDVKSRSEGIELVKEFLQKYLTEVRPSL